MAKKTRIRIGIVMVITCVMCFSDWSFAEDTNNLRILSVSLSTILSYLAWIWVWFAKLAGTFLTNKWVYGEALGWDALLWKYWNLMKNIANFGLGFYFIYVIFKGLIKYGKEDITKNFKNIIVWILIAGIGIQASWFFTAAIVDVSTITLSAAGAFPSQVLSNNPYMVEKIKGTLTGFVDIQSNQVVTGLEITFNDPSQNNGTLVKADYVQIQNKTSWENLVDTLMPSADDVSGPLYYIGFAILNPHHITNIGDTTKNTLYKTLMNIIIQGGTTIVFTLEMFVLCILALMRVLYLWMFIIMSPIAILLWCIQKSGQKREEKSLLSRFMKQINFTSFFVNVFRPTIVVLCLGVSIIFISLMKGVILKSAGTDIGGMSIHNVVDSDSQYFNTKQEADKTYTTTMENDFLRFTFAHAAKGFMEMILCIFSVIIVYFIVKLATMKIGDEKDFVSNTIGKVQDSVGDAFGYLPVVPVKGYDEKGVEKTRWIGAESVFNVTDGSSKLLNETIHKYQTVVDEKYSKQDDIIKGWFGNGTGRLSSSEIGTIERTMQPGGFSALEKVKQEIDKIRDENGKGMTLNTQTASNNGFWMQQFTNWLEGMKGKEVTGGTYKSVWTDMIKRWNNPVNKDKTLEKMFTGNDSGETKSVEAYADFFGLSLSSNKWEQLKNADISKK